MWNNTHSTTFSCMIANCQNDLYAINPSGLNNIKLNTNVSSLPELRPLSEDDRRDYTFSPSFDMFYTFNIEPNRNNTSLNLKNLFVVADSNRSIIKIILFIEGELDPLLIYFDSHLQCEHIVMESFRNNTKNSGYFT